MNADYVGARHYADLYQQANGVLPTCQCGWEGIEVPTYDEATEAYAQHRIETLFRTMPCVESANGCYEAKCLAHNGSSSETS
jgi:hypothetical protein